jgi:BirA family transcriptional regulator, biotin operon repressor / biotin---[acetyl-CoA-carboxylase] ligase
MRETNSINSFKHFHFSQVDSTNNKAKELTTLNNFFFVTAEKQTAGRGRLGNKWISSGESIYQTIVIPKSIFKLKETVLSLVAAISVYKFLAKHVENKNLAIKWPNDILHKELKLAGILIEIHNMHYIIGIGININQTNNFFIENKLNGASFYTITNTFHEVKPLYQDLTQVFSDTIDYYNKNKNSIILDYLKLCGNYKKYIRCRIGKSIKYGYFQDLLDDGSIVLKTDTKTEIILSGEIIE